VSEPTDSSSVLLHEPAARGRCRAKTGTLRGISTLSGYCSTVGGREVAFSILMNGIDPTAARRLQDQMTALIARAR
jgi:serine-type D-Ala-D-Ala carboxypeptidase/endopeptidase (penicillin-binding protein 4)